MAGITKISVANPYFKFKKFTVWHDRCAMKVGTDAVLLGAWAEVSDCKSILDVGTGTGIIALMLAQRGDGNIDAIDIDGDASAQAESNVAASPFAGRIRVVHASLSEFAAASTGKEYDLIVSNPPYFVNSLKCPDSRRAAARHTDSLPLPSLVHDAAGMLSPSGRIALVLPFGELMEVEKAARENALFIHRQTDVIPVRGASPKRLLVELSRLDAGTEGRSRDTLVIEEPSHSHTPEYVSLTRDFYLKM